MYQDNTFDITLILGPLYHLYTEEDAKKAIDEAIRVTKKHGKIIKEVSLADKLNSLDKKKIERNA